jgi:hypothetical protein
MIQVKPSPQVAVDAILKALRMTYTDLCTRSKVEYRRFNKWMRYESRLTHDELERMDDTLDTCGFLLSLTAGRIPTVGRQSELYRLVQMERTAINGIESILK